MRNALMHRSNCLGPVLSEKHLSLRGIALKGFSAVVRENVCYWQGISPASVTSLREREQTCARGDATFLVIRLCGETPFPRADVVRRYPFARGSFPATSLQLRARRDCAKAGRLALLVRELGDRLNCFKTGPAHPATRRRHLKTSSDHHLGRADAGGWRFVKGIPRFPEIVLGRCLRERSLRDLSGAPPPEPPCD